MMKMKRVFWKKIFIASGDISEETIEKDRSDKSGFLFGLSLPFLEAPGDEDAFYDLVATKSVKEMASFDV